MPFEKMINLRASHIFKYNTYMDAAKVKNTPSRITFLLGVN